VNGKSVNEKVGWKSEGYTQKQAFQVRSNRIHDIRHGKELPRSVKVPTFSDAWVLYTGTLGHHPAGDVKRSKGRYNKYLHPMLGSKRLDHITPSMIRQITVILYEDGLKDATVYQYHGLIKRTFDHMINEEGYKGENPMKRVKTPGTKEHRERYLTKQEASDLLAAMRKASTEDYMFTLIGLFTGMRRAEILNIKGKDIDMDTGLIRVDGKGGKIRHCEMNDEIKELLDIFPLAPGEKLFKKRFHLDRWLRVVDGLGLNDGIKSNDRIWRVTPHTLRHTFGSWLGQDGVDLLVINRLMGHSNIQTTMRYIKLAKRPGISAVANLSRGIMI
jgi:integrase